MRKFILLVVAFIIPIGIFFTALEIIVHTIPNSYSYKYNYIKNKGNKVEALALGHSQLYDGFKSETFKIPSFNLCNSAQSFRDDYYIIRELLAYLPNLKTIILPIGYMNVSDNDKETFTDRSTFYHEYMNIDYNNEIPIKYRLECFDPKRAFEKITSYYRGIDIVGCDSLGRRNSHYLRDRHHELGYEKILYDYTVKSDGKMFIQSQKYLEQICELLKSKNIKLVLVSPPYYWSCFSGVNTRQKKFIQDYIKLLKNKFNFQYINLENDKRFEDKDFFNETHLSEIGAEKFTKILNDSISVF